MSWSCQEFAVKAESPFDDYPSVLRVWKSDHFAFTSNIDGHFVRRDSILGGSWRWKRSGYWMNVCEAELSGAASDDLSALASLRTVARRYSRVEDETDDLLQDALLEAVRAGRADLTQTVNYRWVAGTLKKLGAMRARSAARRRMREERWMMERASAASVAEPPDMPSTRQLREWQRHPALETLPPSLRQVAMLALAGHDRREIAWLLDLTDTALRQRISTLRKRLSTFEASPASPVLEACGESGLPLGLIRRALLPVVVASGSAGTHDPDGHLVILGHRGAPGGREAAHVSKAGGNTSSYAVPSRPSVERSK